MSHQTSTRAIRSIAIAGITSGLAGLICKALLQQQDNIQIRGSSRDATRVPQWLKDSPKVTIIETDAYNTENLRSLITGCDVVICCYLADNDTMYNGQKLLIDLCDEAHVPRYIASDFTVDYTKLNFGDNALKDPMKRIKSYLDTKRHVAGIHILNGIFMDLFWEYWAPWDAKSSTLRGWGSGDEVWELTSQWTIAQYTAAVALDPSMAGVFKFVGERKTMHQVAAELKGVHGVTVNFQSLGTLETLKSTCNEEGRQDLLSAGEYHLLTRNSALGATLDNHRFPHIKPETLKEFFAARDVATLSRPQRQAQWMEVPVSKP